MGSRWMRGVVELIVLTLLVGLLSSAAGAAQSAPSAAGAIRSSDHQNLPARSGERSLPAPCGDRYCRQPCQLGIDYFGGCESKNPKVTLLYNGEASGCDYSGRIDWGDGSSETVSFAQPPGEPEDDDPAFVAHHTYTSTGIFDITLSTEVLASSGCTASAPLTLRYSAAILYGQYRVDSVGDSYSSGEGTFDYPDVAGCHQAIHKAWPEMLKSRAHGRIRSVNLLACSGTDSRRLRGSTDGSKRFPDQLTQLRRDKPDLVTLTIGGNDVHFAPVLRDCYIHSVPIIGPFTTGCLKDHVLEHLQRDILAEKHILVQDYIDIAATAPKARILIVGYPELFPSQVWPKASGEECDWLRDVLTRGLLIDDNYLLDDIISSAVLTADNDLAKHGTYDRLTYIDVSQALKGHQLCTRHPWINNLRRSGVQELAHPTPAGQLAIARVVASYIGTNL